MVAKRRRTPLGPLRLILLAIVATGMIFAVRAAFPTPKAGNNTLLGSIELLTAKPQAGDRVFLRRQQPYQVVVRPTAKAHFYVFMVTADRRILALFPTSACAVENPLEKTVQLPSEETAFEASGPTGRCWLIGLAAVRPLTDIPEAFDEALRDRLARADFSEIPAQIRERVRDVLSSDLVPVQAIEIIVD